MYVAGCQIRSCVIVAAGIRPSQPGSARPPGSSVKMKSATFTAMSAFIAVEIGPGPNEKETACGDDG